MNETQVHKGKAFKDLHSADGMFVMPNAWNAGSACMLEAAGFSAVGTTSAGIAFCLALPDYAGALAREAALEETRRIAAAVRIPVSVDAENGYGHTPEEVAETIRRVAETGAVGASIEDYSAAYGTGDLYDRDLAVGENRGGGGDGRLPAVSFHPDGKSRVLSRRTPEPVRGIRGKGQLLSGRGRGLRLRARHDRRGDHRSVGEGSRRPGQRGHGSCRQSIEREPARGPGGKASEYRRGHSPAPPFGLIRRAAAEIREHGTFNYAQEQVHDAELCGFFASRLDRTNP